jgi:transposase-like protein
MLAPFSWGLSALSGHFGSPPSRVRPSRWRTYVRPLAHPDYIRAKAVQMRVERDLTIDEIAERLAISRTTIFYWLKDIPPSEQNTQPRKLAQIRAAEATSAKHQKLRDAAYALGAAEWDELVGEPTFREFVALYIAEGYKRNRNVVQIANSDDRVLMVAVSWLARLTDRKLSFTIQYHADQDLEELRAFWSERQGIEGDSIKMQRKSNSNQLAGRTWRSQHGVLAVWIGDTYLCARLEAWIDRIREDWTLDSAGPHGV